MKLREMVHDAREILKDLRAVHGKRATPEEQTKVGRERALQYFSGGIGVVEHLEPAMVGALFAAVGASRFSISTEGRRLLVKVAGELEDENGEGEFDEQSDDGSDEDDGSHEPAPELVTEFDTTSEDGEEKEARFRERRTFSMKEKRLDLEQLPAILETLTHAEPVSTCVRAWSKGDRVDQLFLLRVIYVAAQLTSRDRTREVASAEA